MELEPESELESELSKLESSLPTILQEGNENSQEVQAVLEINGMEQVPEADSQQLLYSHLLKERNTHQNTGQMTLYQIIVFQSEMRLMVYGCHVRCAAKPVTATQQFVLH